MVESDLVIGGKYHRAFEEVEGVMPLFASNALFSRHTCRAEHT